MPRSNIPSGVSLLAELEGQAADRGTTKPRQELRSDRDGSFDWYIVEQAVDDAISNGEGRVTWAYLKLAFERHGLVVIDTQKEFD